MKVSEIKTTAPEAYSTPLQKRVYEVLSELEIQYERVDNEPAVTMEACEAIDAKLGVKTAKTLFVCNRQKTNFYLFVTAGDKPFVTKDFSRALEISRVSFAPAELLSEMLGVEVGATTIFALLSDEEKAVKLVIDKEVLNDEFFGCPDGTTTSYMKLKTADITGKFLKFTEREPIIIEI